MLHALQPTLIGVTFSVQKSVSRTDFLLFTSITFRFPADRLLCRPGTFTEVTTFFRVEMPRDFVFGVERSLGDLAAAEVVASLSKSK